MKVGSTLRRHHFEFLLRKGGMGNDDYLFEQVCEGGWVGGGGRLRTEVQIAIKESAEEKNGLERGAQLRLQRGFDDDDT